MLDEPIIVHGASTKIIKLTDAFTKFCINVYRKWQTLTLTAPKQISKKFVFLVLSTKGPHFCF